MPLPLVAALCAAVVLAAVAALAVSGRIGTRRAMRSPAQARRVLEELTKQAAATQRATLEDKATAHAGSTPPPEDLPRLAEARTAERTRRRELFFDAAIPGGLDAGIGMYDWLTPDPAAVGALEHMTGTDITNAFDFHHTFQSGGYSWWTDGSLNAWRGHVGEHQIAEQVNSWAGDGFVDMPGASNFAGADLSMFGGDFQVKFVERFSSIDNKNGDVLIVPEDTAGVPDDALHIDFSQPFDPSLLEGHDVIVAEGLTLAGAEDAWADAVGVAAGGIDIDLLGDAGLDALIPGAGALIRVAASGYRRRSGLADPELRKRASKLIARDAAYGVGGAGIGGTIGTVLGAGVDIFTMGTTAGAGMYLGGIAGTAAGGMFGAAKSREADRKLLEDAHAAVNQALATYGTTAETVTAETQRAWTACVASLDEEAATSSTAAKARLAKAREAAQRDLDKLATITAEEVARFASTMKVLASTTTVKLSRRDRYLAARAIARVDATEANAVNTEQILLDVLQMPDAEAAVETWLHDRVGRRFTILAALDAFNTAQAMLAMDQRAKAFERLGNYREELKAFGAEQLDAPAKAVKSATKKFKQEIKLRG